MQHAEWLISKQNQKGETKMLSGSMPDFRWLPEIWIKAFYSSSWRDNYIESCCGECNHTSCLPCCIIPCLVSVISMPLLHLTRQNIEEGFIILRATSRTAVEGGNVFHTGQMKKQHKNMKDRNRQQKCPLMWNMHFEMSGTHWLSCDRINLIPAAPNKIPQNEEQIISK